MSTKLRRVVATLAALTLPLAACSVDADSVDNSDSASTADRTEQAETASTAGATDATSDDSAPDESSDPVPVEQPCSEGAATTSPEALAELAEQVRANGDAQLAADLESAVITFSDPEPSADDLAAAAAAINEALSSVDGLDDSCLGALRPGAASDAASRISDEPADMETVLEEQLGVPADQTECVADRLSTATDEAPDEIELLVAISECANAG